MGGTTGTFDRRAAGVASKGTRRRRSVEDLASSAATWRDGVQIAQTSLWCDAYRARDICFVSSADAVKPSKHGQVIATAGTLALLARRGGQAAPEEALSVPVSRPFTLGTVRLELFRNGHAIGSAGLWVSLAGDRRVAYAGAVCPQGGGLGGDADIRAADTLIIAAPYGTPEYRFPDTASTVERTIAFCRETSRAGVAVLLVRSAVKALDVAARLSEQNIEVWAPREIQHASRKLQVAGEDAPRIRRFTASSARSGRVLLWPLSKRDKLPALPTGSRMALVSGEAAAEGAVARAGADIGVCWSNCADYEGLIRYIDESGAGEVFVLGRHNELLAGVLDSSSRRVRPLGPPKQLALF